MLINCLQHAALEGPGVISDWARERGYSLQVSRLDQGDTPPGAAESDWLLILGGPMGVRDEHLYPWLKTEKHLIRECLDRGTVVVGICLGAQLIADVLGASVSRNRHPELGWFPVATTPEARGRFPLLPRSMQALCWHNDTFAIPSGATLIGGSEACAHQGFFVDDTVLGLQFHLEWPHQEIRKLVEESPAEFEARSRFVQPPHVILSHVEYSQRATSLMGVLLDSMPS